MFTATEDELLMLLAEGQNLTWLADTAGWPTRQIHVFGSRNGYLFNVDGVPYRPTGFGEQHRRRRRPVGAKTW